MTISGDTIVALLGRVLKREVTVNADVPLLEAGPELDSLAMIIFFAELEKLAGVELPQSDAFELLGSSVNQIAARLSELSDRRQETATRG